jgi:hypothetical protein
VHRASFVQKLIVVHPVKKFSFGTRVHKTLQQWNKQVSKQESFEPWWALDGQ